MKDPLIKELKSYLQSFMLIRQEKPQDYDCVQRMTRQAFWNLFQPGSDQHLIVHKIRKSPEFVKELSLVAEENHQIVAHIIYYRTQVKYANGATLQAITFGPLTVHPEKQLMGIGKLLLNYSLQKAKQLGFKGVIIQGHPYYYPRFGFKRSKFFNIKDIDGEYHLGTMALQLEKDYFLKETEGIFLGSEFLNLTESQIEAFQGNFSKKQKFRTRSQEVFNILITKKWNEDCQFEVTDYFNRQKIEQ